MKKGTMCAEEKRTEIANRGCRIHRTNDKSRKAHKDVKVVEKKEGGPAGDLKKFNGSVGAKGSRGEPLGSVK